VLVNNAGRYVHDFQRTQDGFETTFALNHLAPFVLTHRLMPALQRSDQPTVITTASMAERVGPIDLERFASGVPYSAWRAYGWSKQANVHFARELARRAPSVTSASFHPGFVATGFGHTGGGLLTPLLKGAQRLFGRTPEQGADTGAWLAAHPKHVSPNGAYFVDRAAQTPSKAGRDDDMAAELWRRSEAWAELDEDLRLSPA
jgi:NAD(P)-dependent dehydrogenase (short-subunit alcohol dehydrogenase family)